MRTTTRNSKQIRRKPIREGFGEDLFRVTVYEDAFKEEFDSYESTDFGRVLDFANAYADGQMNFKFENEDTGESCKVTSKVWETAIDRDTYPSCVLDLCDDCYVESFKRRKPIREGKIRWYNNALNEGKFLDRVKYASEASKVANKYYKDIKRDPKCNDMSRGDKRKEAIKRYFDNDGKYTPMEERRCAKKLSEKVFELPSMGDKKSFYGKAQVNDNEDGAKVLYSYGTPVARIKDRHYEEIPASLGGSQTTKRHKKAFRKFYADEIDECITSRKQAQEESVALGATMAKVATILAPIAYEVSADLISVLAQRLSEKLKNVDPDKIIEALKRNLGKIKSFADIDKAVEKTYASFSGNGAKTEGVEERDKLVDDAVEKEVTNDAINEVDVDSWTSLNEAFDRCDRK